MNLLILYNNGRGQYFEIPHKGRKGNTPDDSTLCDVFVSKPIPELMRRRAMRRYYIILKLHCNSTIGNGYRMTSQPFFTSGEKRPA